MNSIKIAALQIDNEELGVPTEYDLKEAIDYIEPDVEATTISYLGNGNVEYIEYFDSLTKITANRIARTDFTFNGDLTVATEELKIYADNGTTITKTYLWTYEYTDENLTSYKREIV